MDQFWAGSTHAMSPLLSVAIAQPLRAKGELRGNASARCREGNPLWEWAGVDFLEGPEMVLADFLWRRNLSFYAVNLGLAKVPNVPMLRMPPCLLCYDCYSADPFVRVR